MRTGIQKRFKSEREKKEINPSNGRTIHKQEPRKKNMVKNHLLSQTEVI